VGLQTLGVDFELSFTVELYVTFEPDFALELYLSLPCGTYELTMYATLNTSSKTEMPLKHARRFSPVYRSSRTNPSAPEAEASPSIQVAHRADADPPNGVPRPSKSATFDAGSLEQAHSSFGCGLPGGWR
jgi:hypothetical protein